VALLAFVGVMLGFSRCTPRGRAAHVPYSSAVTNTAAPPQSSSPAASESWPSKNVCADWIGEFGLGRLQADAESVWYLPRGGPVGSFTLRADVCVRPNDFFGRYATDFGIRAGLDAVIPDSLQRRPSAVSLHQTFKGVVVTGRHYILQLRSDGCVDRGAGHLVSPLHENVAPKISVETARWTACRRVGVAQSPYIGAELKLVQDPSGGGLPGTFRLVWIFHPGDYSVLIDADDGGIYSCVADGLDVGPGCPATALPSARRLVVGKLSFGGRFNATIYLDGLSLGLLPRSQVAVTPGPHTVVVEGERTRIARTVEVAANESVFIDAEPD
jgi:hypothetical protein